MIDTTHYTPGQLDLLGRAADVINTNSDAYKEFKEARTEPTSTWTDAQLINKIEEYFRTKDRTVVGWWYGRVTDPRRKENE